VKCVVIVLSRRPSNPGTSSTVWYVPFDVGVRGNLGVGAVRPFVGTLGSLAVRSEIASDDSFRRLLPGFGANVGAELHLLPEVQFGVELRGTEIPVELSPGSPTRAQVLSLLLSVKLQKALNRKNDLPGLRFSRWALRLNPCTFPGRRQKSQVPGEPS
jgi:hypothetical protein